MSTQINTFQALWTTPNMNMRLFSVSKMLIQGLHLKAEIHEVAVFIYILFNQYSP